MWDSHGRQRRETKGMNAGMHAAVWKKVERVLLTRKRYQQWVAWDRQDSRRGQLETGGLEMQKAKGERRASATAISKSGSRGHAWWERAHRHQNKGIGSVSNPSVFPQIIVRWGAFFLVSLLAILFLFPFPTPSIPPPGCRVLFWKLFSLHEGRRKESWIFPTFIM